MFEGLEVQREDPTSVWDKEEIIGEGAYGYVFKASHKYTGEVAAIKCIPLTDGGVGLSAIKKEVAILADCSHPNIVAYYGCYVKDDELWIAMEYCGGGSLQDIYGCLRSPFREDQIALVTREVLKGLAYLHSRKKIHRDIKAGNILLTDHGEVKLADFGVSAQLNSTVSRRVTFVGTPYWMAPEVIYEEESYNGNADIWSLGITCLELSELAPPNAHMHPMRALFAISTGPAPRFREPSKWTSAYRDFVKRCLTKNPDKRPAASDALKHPFVQNCRHRAILLEPIERARHIRQLIAANVPLDSPQMQAALAEPSAAIMANIKALPSPGPKGPPPPVSTPSGPATSAHASSSAYSHSRGDRGDGGALVSPSSSDDDSFDSSLESFDSSLEMLDDDDDTTGVRGGPSDRSRHLSSSSDSAELFKDSLLEVVKTARQLESESLSPAPSGALNSRYQQALEAVSELQASSRVHEAQMQSTLAELAGLKALYLETLSKHRAAAAEIKRLRAKVTERDTALASAKARNAELMVLLASPSKQEETDSHVRSLQAENNRLTQELNTTTTDLMLARLDLQRLRLAQQHDSATTATR